MILEPTDSTQTITFIPNVEVTNGQSATVSITRSGTSVTNDTVVSLQNRNEWVDAAGVFSVKEGGTYDIEIKIGNNPIYNDLAQATSQNPEDYQTVSSDLYNNADSDNTFRIPND